MSTAESRYREALELYRTTNLTVKEICRQTDTPEIAFRSYVRRYHRDLLFARHGISVSTKEEAEKPLRKPKGQSSATHAKYKEAILACDDEEFLEFNISEIARMFNLSPTGLSNQLHNHFPEILERREKERQRLGLGDNRQRGERNTSTDQYAEAVAHLHKTTDTILETAEHFNLSYGGLREYLLRYNKDLINKREKRRNNAKGNRIRGELTGNGSLHLPDPREDEKYGKAIEMYRYTAMTLQEIAEKTGVTLSGLGNYIRRWHRDLMLERRGVVIKGSEELPELSATKPYLKSTAAKYAEAISMLKESGKSTAEVAKKFGFNPDIFRSYLHEHEPELAKANGMTTNADGKKVRNRSAQKYEEAIRLFSTTTEDLKSISARLGVNYKSISSFVRRNCKDALEAHNRLLKSKKR